MSPLTLVLIVPLPHKKPHSPQLCKLDCQSTAVKLGGGLNNHLAETRADLKHSSSLLTASSSGNSRHITCQEASAAGTQQHASAQALSLTGEYPPSARQSRRETRSSLDNSRRTAERLHFSRSIGAEVKLLKWLLSQREQMLGYPLH